VQEYTKSGDVGARHFTVPPLVVIDDGTNLTDPVWDNAAQHPETVQFTRRTPDGGWQDVTCAQFRVEVVNVARGLIAAGIGVGDRVALMSKTRYEWTLLDYAIWSAGAVTVPIYETSSPEQIQWILADSGAVAALVETDAHRAAVDALRDGPGSGDSVAALRHVWQIEAGTAPAGDSPAAVTTLVEAGTPIPIEEVEHRRRESRADDLATIVYTSGTTGRPMGCMLTHRNIYADIANAIPVLANIFTPGASTLLFLPLAHSFARLIQAGVVQGRVRTAHAPDVKNLVDDLKAVRPTFVLAVPRVFEKVYNAAKQRAHADGKGAIFDLAERVAVQYSEALDRPGRVGLATGWCTPSCAPRSAATVPRPSRVAPRSAPRWRTSSGASG
jgi:long-chain acyl-CoA synthetase